MKQKIHMSRRCIRRRSFHAAAIHLTCVRPQTFLNDEVCKIFYFTLNPQVLQFHCLLLLCLLLRGILELELLWICVFHWTALLDQLAELLKLFSTLYRELLVSWNLYMKLIERTFILFLYPADNSDFEPLSNQILTILPTTPFGSPVCQQITIIGDNVDEDDETFTITTSVTSPNTITFPSTATVTIVDDDIKL